MTQILRQSTQVIVMVGPFVDVTDGFTPETGITLGAADEAELLKANTTTTTDISGATWAAVSGCDGWYGLTLTTSHTDTVGPLTVMINDDSVCLPVFARFQVIEEAAYDTMYAASASPASTTNITAGTITTATNVTTVNGLAAGVITAASIAADAITDAKVASDVTIASVTGSVGSVTGAVGSVTGNVGGNVTGSVGSVVGAVGSVTGLTAANLDVAVSTRLATAGYTAPLDAAGTRTAMGLASANLDTQLGDLPTATENADALLNRDMSAVSDTNDRTPLNALRFLRNKFDTTGGTLTVTKEDDSTTAWTSALTTDPAAEPVTGSNPV